MSQEFANDDAPPRPPSSPHRSRRQRKKLMIDEFAVLGFSVAYKIDESTPFQVADAMMDRFIEEAIEGNGLACGGGGTLYSMEFHVVGSRANRHVTATPDQRQAVLDWLTARAQDGVHSPIVGPLEDSNYLASSSSL